MHNATTPVSCKLPRPAAAIACHEGTLICTHSRRLEPKYPSATTVQPCVKAVLMHPLLQYLLGYLEGISDAPRISDPDFQQLLVDVQASKVSDSTRRICPSVARQIQNARSLTRALSSHINMQSSCCNRCFLFLVSVNSLNLSHPMHSSTAWRRSSMSSEARWVPPPL